MKKMVQFPWVGKDLVGWVTRLRPATFQNKFSITAHG
jgi:hypothetical protein